ncbi:hypothetical protein DMB65_08125 [Flavobacterium cheongpyeongense]|uniref:Phytase-like domain-containing protein n=1 Tax=Flavobacterium cheongpyeongense TaxID=2212651 RepID=A0A2V4BQR0_9FLAO|nr:SdiA-regulated domain-containing protein [Flavobacterium cheongpyeongense]PXY41359.1 hypothetical protein DMB65_08125 [Flavobacterium cheongpyeongense]
MKNILLFLGLLYSALGYSQFNFPQQEMKLDIEINHHLKKKDYHPEISGMTMLENDFYVVCEKDNRILKYDTQFNLVDSIKIPLLSELPKPEYEGIAVYKDHFLLSDEKNVTIIDFTNKTIIPISVPEINGMKDDSGVEGIAIDAEAKKCYLMQEKTGSNGYSILLDCDITEDNGHIKLTTKNSIIINHTYLGKEKDTISRYSDIYVYNHKIYALKLHYPENPKYYIDEINIDAIRKDKPKDWKIDNSNKKYFNSKEITDFINKEDSNIEAVVLSKKDNYFYIINDDKMSDKKDKTTLYKLKNPFE